MCKKTRYWDYQQDLATNSWKSCKKNDKVKPKSTIFDNITDYSGLRIKRLSASALLDGYRRWLVILHSIILHIEQDLLKFGNSQFTNWLPNGTRNVDCLLKNLVKEFYDERI